MTSMGKKRQPKWKRKADTKKDSLIDIYRCASVIEITARRLKEKVFTFAELPDFTDQSPRVNSAG